MISNISSFKVKILIFRQKKGYGFLWIHEPRGIKFEFLVYFRLYKKCKTNICSHTINTGVTQSHLLGAFTE